MPEDKNKLLEGTNQIEMCNHPKTKTRLTLRLKVCDKCWSDYKNYRFMGTWVDKYTYNLLTQFCINHEMSKHEAFGFFVHESAFAFTAEAHAKSKVDKQFEKKWEPLRKRWQHFYQKKLVGQTDKQKVPTKIFREDDEFQELVAATMAFVKFDSTALMVAALSLVRFQGIYPSVQMALAIIPEI